MTETVSNTILDKKALLIYTSNNSIDEMLDEGLIPGILQCDLEIGKAVFECRSPIYFNEVSHITVGENTIEIRNAEETWLFAIFS